MLDPNTTVSLNRATLKALVGSATSQIYIQNQKHTSGRPQILENQLPHIR